MKTLHISTRELLAASVVLAAAIALCVVHPLNAAFSRTPATTAAAKCSCFDGAANCFFDGNKCPSSGGKCNCTKLNLSENNGNGGEATLQSKTCSTCGGSGQVLSSCAVCGGDGTSSTGNTCQSCAGTGKRYKFCSTCGGDGTLSSSLKQGCQYPDSIGGASSTAPEPLATCGLKCIENCGSTCTKAHHHKGFHKCGNGHTF